MSINILFSLNIYHVIHLFLFWLVTAKVPNGMGFNKTILRRAAFLIIWIGSSNKYHSFYKGNRGWRVCEGWAVGWRETVHMKFGSPCPKCATQNITQLPTSTKQLPTFIKTTLKIHRIMNGLKECIWKQREPNYTPSCNRVPRSYTK